MHEDCVLACRRTESELVESDDFSTSLDDASSGPFSDPQGTDLQNNEIYYFSKAPLIYSPYKNVYPVVIGNRYIIIENIRGFSKFGTVEPHYIMF